MQVKHLFLQELQNIINEYLVTYKSQVSPEQGNLQLVPILCKVKKALFPDIFFLIFKVGTEMNVLFVNCLE